MADRVRIGIYEPGRGPSGPSRYVDGLLEALDDSEFDVTVFGHRDGPYSSRPGLRLIPIRRGDLDGPTSGGGHHSPAGAPAGRASGAWKRAIPRSLKLWAGFARDARVLARDFRSRPVDLMHTNNTGCEESSLAARMAGIPHVVGTLHVDSRYDLEGARDDFRHRCLERVGMHCLDRAIAVSRATGSDWARRTGYPIRRIVTIPNGIDPDRFARRTGPQEARRRLGLPSGDGPVVGGVGRIEPAKGFADLIEAFALLAGDHPGATLVIAGTGPLRGELEALADRLGVAHRVFWIGYQADVQLVYDALDVFALPSLCEAMPYALLEAMAAGLPSVGAAVGGVPEVIIPGEVGVLVPPRDPAALALALGRLFASQPLRRRMGWAARERSVGHFDGRASARATVQVYRDLLGSARPEPSSSAGVNRPFSLERSAPWLESRGL